MRTLDRVRRAGERLMEAVSREYYLAYAGLKPTAELQRIYAEHAGAYDDDALDAAREAWRDAPEGSEERRGARLLLEWLAETRSARALAEHDEREIAWESSAHVQLGDGRQVPYQRASIEIANTADRAERLRLEAARAALVAREFAPLRQERVQRELEHAERLGVASGYAATFTALSGIDLEPLRAQCAAFLADTQPMWDEVLPAVLRRQLGIRREEAQRADGAVLLRMPQFDGGFPAGAMEATVRTQVASMGVDPGAAGRIRLDVGEREGKRARAFCSPVRIPDEVYLVLRPHGGVGDWRTYLHELGHALHFAHMDGALPFEYRWLGDNSVTEGFAMLFDHLLHDRGWLRRHATLTTAEREAFDRANAFEELLMLRRYCGKLLYELRLYDGSVPWRSLPDLYVETLTAATGLRYAGADAFVDVDARFYVARYLRAWQLQAVLTEALRDAFNEDWWRNPAAGPWVVGQLFAPGQRELGDELATRVAGRALSFAPLLAGLERRLA